MFRSLHDHHQAYLRIKLIDAGYMLRCQPCLQFTLMCAWPITYKARENFFKVVAVIDYFVGQGV